MTDVQWCNELHQIQDFILKFTKFEFKSDNSAIYAYFNYEGINLSVEGWSIDRTTTIKLGNEFIHAISDAPFGVVDQTMNISSEIQRSKEQIILVMINDETKKAYKIYQRNKKIETILK